MEEKARMLTSGPSSIVVLYTMVGCIAILILTSLIENGGVFSYTIDDGYIHLAIARHIQEGLYGINTGEFSAAASSILFPFLLALVPSKIPGWEFLPLLINVLSMVIAVKLFVRVLGIDGRLGVAPMMLLALTLTIALNIATLVMSGMEHALQVALTVMGISGLIQLEKTGHLSKITVAALILGPLVRYENLAITLPACGYLALLGRRRASLGVLATVVFVLVAFSTILVSHGLEVLPTSILSRTIDARVAFLLSHDFRRVSAAMFAQTVSHVAHMGILSGLVLNLISNLANIQSWILLSLTAPLVVKLVKSHDPIERRLAGLAVTAVTAHMIGGTFDGSWIWLVGYEMYVFAAVLLILAAVYGEWFRRVIFINTSPVSWVRPSMLLIVTALVFYRYTYALLGVPLSTNFHYELETQVARFDRDYWKSPIGVEPLGTANWVNTYVLDYGGLSSWDVHKARTENPPDPLWMETVARQHNVALVVIYEIPIVPPSWHTVARLRWTSDLGNKLAGRTLEINFYATDSKFVPRIRAALEHFSATLPNPSSLEWVPAHEQLLRAVSVFDGPMITISD